MFEQSFELADIFKVLTLTFLELALSADNAIVLGVLIHSVAQELRQKALFIGAFSAIVLRLFAVISASYLLHFLWIQWLGAGYLIYLSAKYFFRKRRRGKTHQQAASFWKAVILIECFDLLFAIDSIIAGVGLIGPAKSTIHPKLWIVYLGGVIGLVITRYAAHLLSDLIDRFPRLGMSAHLLIGWVGLELAVNAIPLTIPYFGVVFWVGIVVLFLFGFTEKKTNSCL